MASVEYDALKTSVSGLENDLLNFLPKVTEPYSNDELLKCQAYVVFSHAEIQVYWETVSRRILREAEHRWTVNKTVDRVLATLVAYRRSDRVTIPNNPADPESIGDFAKMVEEAVSNQKEAIDKNNGIKRANLAGLLCPLGLFKWDFSETFLIQSDQTGKKRGEIVHKSSKVSLRNVRDPFSDEKHDIDNLISEIGLIDGKLETFGLLSIPPEQIAA